MTSLMALSLLWEPRTAVLKFAAFLKSVVRRSAHEHRNCFCFFRSFAFVKFLVDSGKVSNDRVIKLSDMRRLDETAKHRDDPAYDIPF